ncbi:amidase signature domain-containing protein [Naematelia encephala]|uniref:amidase n=1 Tax=Naematelia encephala TaxID=71784 RepID=A0A1Y2AM99_9TREE|nr:amidase signature domain-containing protein [Naematelia encephala]
MNATLRPSADVYPLPQNVSNLVSTCGILAPREVEIVSLDATGLRDLIANTVFTAVEVTVAFSKAAAVAHQATNCLTNFLPQEALDRAKWLDAEFTRTGQPVGPLHGVPVSIKDTVGLVGTDSNCGFVSWIGKNIATKDATLVSILLKAGAVIIAKTTLPQTVMHLETDSFLGPTVNPYNTTLTSGGSSGGEGALIASGASVLGIGTDIGGSVRCPAAHCGIFGFKPTVGRLPRGGNKGLMVIQETILGTAGPMARSHRDLELFISVILAAKPWELEIFCVRMPWRAEGIVWKGGKTPRIAVDKLSRAGLVVVECTPWKAKESWELISSLYWTDGGARVKTALEESGEPMLPLTEWILSQNAKPRTGEEIMQLNVKRELFRQAWHEYFQSTGVDVVLCPPSAGPAPVLGTSRYWTYTAFWNLVDAPSGIFPTGLSVGLEDVADQPRDFLSEQDKEITEQYSPEKFIDAPLSLQVAGPRWADESVMSAMGIISDIVRA